jgi:hypothetical protein
MAEEQTTPQAPEPKSVNFNDRFFKANGKTYFIADKISVNRWKQYEKLMPRLTYGIDFDSIQKSLLRAYGALNEKKFADAAVILHNLMSGIKDANDDKRIHPALLMAALLINAEGEDAGIYDEQTQLNKIKDWEKEGLDILGFFAFALNTINGFRETYLLYIKEQAEEVLGQSQFKKTLTRT